MGWLRPSKDPSKHLHSLAGRIEVESQDSIDTKATYPIQSKKVKDEDLPFIPAEEVMKRHGKEGCNLWIVVDDIVLDATTFVARHPGGRHMIQGFAGEDAGWQWWTIHDRKTWNEVAMTLRVGRTADVENKHVRPETMLKHR